MKLVATAFLVLAAGLRSAAVDVPGPHLLLPPGWERSVVFHHGFGKGAAEPEINTARLRIVSTGVSMTEDGLIDRALVCDPGQPYRIEGDALSVARPVTVMLWWRLDEAMRDETNFNLITLAGRGHIASFVRGKGEWCALREPTRISQIHGFKDIPNHNNPWGGKADFERGQWHHCAITVGNGSDVKIYWDGLLREAIAAKARKFAPEDVRTAELGANWLAHPMSIDQVIVLNRVLSAEEISAYVSSTMALHRLDALARQSEQRH
jgi:hypothetical protein